MAILGGAAASILAVDCALAEPGYVDAIGLTKSVYKRWGEAADNAAIKSAAKGLGVIKDVAIVGNAGSGRGAIIAGSEIGLTRVITAAGTAALGPEAAPLVGFVARPTATFIVKTVDNTVTEAQRQREAARTFEAAYQQGKANTDAASRFPKNTINEDIDAAVRGGRLTRAQATSVTSTQQGAWQKLEVDVTPPSKPTTPAAKPPPAAATPPKPPATVEATKPPAPVSKPKITMIVPRTVDPPSTTTTSRPPSSTQYSPPATSPAPPRPQWDDVGGVRVGSLDPRQADGSVRIGGLVDDKPSKTYERPGAALGSDPDQPSAKDRQYDRPSVAMNTPQGSSCIDYNSVGPSVCKDGSDQTSQGPGDGGDVTGRWAMDGGSCASPVTVTQTEMRGFISPMQNAYCNISGLVPVQPPRLWRFQLSCMGNQGGAIDVRLSRADANRLTYSSCFQGSHCSSGTMTRCN